MSKRQAKSTTRTRLLGAATEAVAHHGYADTSVAQIIANAGASRSTFYEHFADKDECILAAAATSGERLTSVVEQRTATEQPQRVPWAVAEAIFEFARKDGTQARVVFTELLAGGSRAMDLRDGLIDRLAALVEEAWRRDEQRPTLDLPALALIGGIFRLLSFRIRRGGSGLHQLQPAVLSWMDTYALHEGVPGWQSAAVLDALPVPPVRPTTPVLTPSPLPKGRHGLDASAIEKNHRDRLLHATAACVYREDYAAVAVADIVGAAQVSRSVFYSLFRDKQAAIMATMQHTFETSMSACAAAFFAAPVTSSSWPSQLWEAARALSDYYANAPDLVSLAFVEGYAVGPTSIQLVEERMRAFTLLLESGYRHRPEAADLPPSISEIIAFATFELAYREIRHRKPPRFSHLLPQLAYVNLAPFMGAPAATEFVHDKMRALTQMAERGSNPQP